jgi:hypothetical protein
MPKKIIKEDLLNIVLNMKKKDLVEMVNLYYLQGGNFNIQRIPIKINQKKKYKRSSEKDVKTNNNIYNQIK